MASSNPTTGPCYQISFPAHYAVAVLVKGSDEVGEYGEYKDKGYYAYTDVSSITVKGNNVLEIKYEPDWGSIKLATELYQAWLRLQDCLTTLANKNDTATYEKYKPLYDEVERTGIPDLIKHNYEKAIPGLLDELTFDVGLTEGRIQRYIDLVNAAIAEIEKSY